MSNILCNDDFDTRDSDSRSVTVMRSLGVVTYDEFGTTKTRFFIYLFTTQHLYIQATGLNTLVILKYHRTKIRGPPPENTYFGQYKFKDMK